MPPWKAEFLPQIEHMLTEEKGLVAERSG
jgi:hypothetical protein